MRLSVRLAGSIRIPTDSNAVTPIIGLGIIGTYGVFMGEFYLSMLILWVLLIIAGGVIFWSFATIFTSHVHVFSMLLLTRAFVGVGEAAYAPAAQSMISGAFSPEARARAQST